MHLFIIYEEHDIVPLVVEWEGKTFTNEFSICRERMYNINILLRMDEIAMSKLRLSYSHISRSKGLKSVPFIIIGLLILSYGLIGGCNNDGSGQNAEALRIGQLNGWIVAAVNAEYFIKKWKEGDSANNFFLQGNIAGQLTQAEQEALNNAYQAGYFIALIDPVLKDKLDLLGVLGLRQDITDENKREVFAVIKQPDMDSPSYYHLHAIPDIGVPPRFRFQRDRVITLKDFVNQVQNNPAPKLGSDNSSGMTVIPDVCGADQSPQSKLNCIAKKKEESHTFSIQDGAVFEGITEDFFGNFTVTFEAWAAHSVANNSDFYMLFVTSNLVPNTTFFDSTNDTWPCNPALFINGALVGNEGHKGAGFYIIDSFLPSFFPPNPFSSENVSVLADSPSPPTTEGEDSTTTSVSRTIDGSVSYEDGSGGVGIGESLSYEKDATFSSPSVFTTEDNSKNVDQNSNNTSWKFFVFDTEDIKVSSWGPAVTWIWEAKPPSRTAIGCNGENSDDGFCIPVMVEMTLNYFSISCFGGDAATTQTPSDLVVNIPVPPTPPPPTPTPTPPPPCTSNSDCMVPGEVCDTGVTPAICVPQQCDEMMTCPLNSQCINEVCKPINN